MSRRFLGAAPGSRRETRRTAHGAGCPPCRPLLLALALAVSAVRLAYAQQPADERAGPRRENIDDSHTTPAAPSGSLDVVVARVNGEELRVRDVERLVAEATGGRAVVEEGLPRLRAEALDQLIDRRLIQAELIRRKLAPQASEVDAALDALRQELARRQVSFSTYLDKGLHTEDSLRQQILWDLSWRAYVLGELNEQTLQDAFARHKRHLDGTEVRVSHILLRVQEPKNPTSVQAAIDRAQRIREEILSGKLTFAQAAEKYSSGPSRRRGGDLGFIPRRDRMVEAFSAAAFALEVGEISQPVLTQFGVHLILCTDIKPGTKMWSDVQGELEVIVARERFDALAAELRPRAAIEFTGAYPYLEAGRLVVPTSP